MSEHDRDEGRWFDDSEQNDSPFCECQLDHCEEELAFNCCAACGKEIE